MGTKVQTLELLLLLPLPSLGSHFCSQYAPLFQHYHGEKRGVAHLPPKVRLRNCGAWSFALLRNSYTKQ
jgi:hypothetical protein